MSLLVIVGFLIVVALGLAIVGAGQWRHHRGAALVALGAALGLILVTTTSIWPALTDETHIVEQRRLRQQVAEIVRERDTLVAEASTTRLQNKSLESIHLATLDRIEREVSDVHRRYRERGGDIVLDTARVDTGALARVDALAANVQALKNLRTKPPAPLIRVEPASPRETSTRDLVRLRDQLAATVKTDNYDVEPYPARELVGGRQGKYYMVDMKNASSGIRYFFDGGKYVLRTGHAEFRSSLNVFIADVLAKMEGNVRYDLFVRGNADSKPYEGRVDPAHEYKQVSYLLQNGTDRYASQTGQTILERGVVRNSDLPNLRAAFMRDLVASTYPVKTPIILEGAIAPKINDRDRNVELILFVDW